MNKNEFVRAIAEKANLTIKDTEAAVKAFADVVKDEVAAGNKVQLIGFGTFEARKRNARTGVNPATGEKIEIPETTVPAFKVGKAFKEAVNPPAPKKEEKKIIRKPGKSKAGK